MRAPGFWFAVALVMLTGCPTTTTPTTKASTKPKASTGPGSESSPSTKPSVSPSPTATPTSKPTDGATATPTPSPSASATTGATPTPAGTATPTATPTASPTATPTATPTPGLAAAVEIKDFSFTPASVTIKVGGTVTFTNKGVAAHTVSPVTGLTFNDTGAINANQSKSITFPMAGTANYQCNFHTSMKGTITVVP